MTTDGDGLDRGRLDELKSLDASGAMLRNVIATFDATTGQLLGDLESQLDSGQDDPARETAHTLAGRALMIGATAAGESARSLEHCLVAGDPAGARTRWPDVQQAFARARESLAAYVAD
ncbi:Hpt domain-containing protein [Nocardioides rotundus]|uniref:Hpt domain-containing protein n=1 Tax=Nocardioides rotundus TaxID=1774216 RepID=UPI001CBECD0A|nr:Hpt domain-containing protein [Nocardioides rotundus]UAL29675.1 Hpt domain-containing protein [Nocardioides rotundus]